MNDKPVSTPETAIEPKILEKRLEQNTLLRQKLGEDYKLIVREIVREIEIVAHSAGSSASEAGLGLPTDLVERLSKRIPGFEQEFWDLIRATFEQSIKESNHRMEMEKTDRQHVGREIAIREAQEQHVHVLGSRGLNYGFIVAGGLVVGAIVTGILGVTTVAVALVGASAVGMVSGFIQAGQQRQESRKVIAAPEEKKRLSPPENTPKKS